MVGLRGAGLRKGDILMIYGKMYETRERKIWINNHHNNDLYFVIW